MFHLNITMLNLSIVSHFVSVLLLVVVTGCTSGYWRFVCHMLNGFNISPSENIKLRQLVNFFSTKK